VANNFYRSHLSNFGAQVPKEREMLESIPGVGSKTAAVIISNAFNIPAIAVDTHVARIARRLGLTQQKNPDKVERELSIIFPRNRLLEAHHALIFHGRRICFARKPACSNCPVEKFCPKIGVVESQ
jgi:endonuclease-3